MMVGAWGAGKYLSDVARAEGKFSDITFLKSAAFDGSPCNGNRSFEPFPRWLPQPRQTECSRKVSQDVSICLGLADQRDCKAGEFDKRDISVRSRI
jgi:hypothetical protein